MPTSKFDLVQSLPQKLQPELKAKKINNTDCRTAAVDTSAPTTADDSDAGPPSATCRPTATGRGHGLMRTISESLSIGSEIRKGQDNRGSLVPDTLSQRQLDDLRSNCGRKTVILLDENTEHGNTNSRLLDDKGFSRSSHLSIVYGTMLVLFGVAFPVTEVLQDAWLESHVVGVFMTYLFAGASIFVLYLEIHEAILLKRPAKPAARRHNNNHNNGFISEENKSVDTVQYNPDKDYLDTFNAHPNATALDDSGQTPTGMIIRRSSHDPEDNQTNTSLANTDDGTPSIYTMGNDVTDDVYDYITMHHGTATIASGETNYFLKIGLLLFAVANMVYVALRIEGEHHLSGCSNQPSIIYPHYVHLAFIILQTFFITKVCKHALRSHKAFVNFGLMHVVATNLCVWFRYLVIEVVESLHKEDEADGHASDFSLQFTEANTTNRCSIEPIMMDAGHYLFPFILEYSLIAMTAIIFMYSNINIRVTGKLYRSICEALHKQRVARAKGDALGSADYSKSHSALEKSHRGLALGVVVLAGVVVSIVLFFYWKGAGDIHKAQMCHAISELIILLLFILNTIVGMYHLYHFIFNPASVNTLDNTLLLISANFLLVLKLFVVFSKIAYMTNEDADTLVVIELISSITCMIQAILQVAFITDGMQRVSVKEEQIREKRGRGVITFLIILNVAMWIFQSFQEKYSEQMEEIEMYGEVAWAIISSLCHPLRLFFYFHSSICLAHMWHHCYEEPEDNVMANELAF